MGYLPYAYQNNAIGRKLGWQQHRAECKNIDRTIPPHVVRANFLAAKNIDNSSEIVSSTRSCGGCSVCFLPRVYYLIGFVNHNR